MTLPPGILSLYIGIFCRVVDGEAWRASRDVFVSFETSLKRAWLFIKREFIRGKLKLLNREQWKTQWKW